MSKIGIIIEREYLHVVRKKSFLIMTILGPLIMAALIFIPSYLLLNDNEQSTIAVVDKSGLFADLNAVNDKSIAFEYPQNPDLVVLKRELVDKKYDALLFIPANELQFNGMVYSASSLRTGVMSNILASMKRILSNRLIISEFNISQDSLDYFVSQITDAVSLGYTFIDEDGVEQPKSSYLREIQQVVGIFAGLLIYMFIFMYCSMVLRGVLEEKTTRIVEVIVSSVKPVQLMVGKIVGVCLIALTQVAIWAILLGLILMIAMPPLLPQPEQFTQIDIQAGDLAAILSAVNFSQILTLLGLFLFYFMAGYFLYASLYAAVGSAVDNDTDTQQLTLPITMPLILSLILLTYITNHPDGAVAFWFSIIPLTSPIVMMMRLPGISDNVATWEIFLSCGILLMSCFLAAYAAAKVYKTGILMYGKKNTYKELWKWIKYKN
ncbi:MAG: ABC transporter permease [Bacteroidales bacterium]|jgi:ABC-2 type transport system permease protein|nr:ABC transporter permease [Bacteroidales bacterium]